MRSFRVIPCLLLSGARLVKTRRFAEPRYLGDPINTVKIFNEKQVDELVLLDISATPARRPPDFETLSRIASECFMPLAYGGGLRELDQIERVLKLGVEKIVVNTRAAERPEIVAEAAGQFGSQSIVVAIDVKRGRFGRFEALVEGGQRPTGIDPVEYGRRMRDLGAGELLLNSVDRDGTMEGYELELVRLVSAAVDIPVVACGGAGKVEDFALAVRAGASAAAAGSLFVFQGRHRAVLISYPSPEELDALLAS